MAKHTRKHSRKSVKKTRRVRKHRGGSCGGGCLRGGATGQRGGGCPKSGQPCPERCSMVGGKQVCKPHAYGEDNCKGYRGAQHCDSCKYCGDQCIWS